MGLEEYKSAMWRFTWKGRSVDDQHEQSVSVLAPCKDQTGAGGVCSFMGCATAMEAHLRMNGIFDEICYDDLGLKTDPLKTDPVWSKKSKVHRCFHIIKERGAVTVATKANPPEKQASYKVRRYEAFQMGNEGAINASLKQYMRVGPMVGVFPVNPRKWSQYKDTNPDAIYFFNNKTLGVMPPETHCVALVGFGVQAQVPFWPFKNSYGEKWRRYARGYGQLFAPSLIELYGFELELGQ